MRVLKLPYRNEIYHFIYRASLCAIDSLYQSIRGQVSKSLSVSNSLYSIAHESALIVTCILMVVKAQKMKVFSGRTCWKNYSTFGFQFKFWIWILNGFQHFNDFISVDCSILVSGTIGFCACHSCTENEGDCDSHDECQGNLVCGSNNCLGSSNLESKLDCCYAPMIGDEHFCSIQYPCAENEGDCDFHGECLNDLQCGSNNCPNSLGLHHDVDCCTKQSNNIYMFIF